MRIATFDVWGSKGFVPVPLRVLAGCVAVFLAGLAATAAAQTYEALFKTCYASSLPDRVIASCSALISRRLAAGQDLATAFKNRGNADDDKGDHIRAMADFGEALAINARDADAYNSRGTTYTALGQYDRAILDFTRPRRSTPGAPWRTATDASPERCWASSRPDWPTATKPCASSPTIPARWQRGLSST